MMKFDVVIEQDEAGMYVADVPVLPGCHTQGQTEQEALENIKEAITGHLKSFGHPITRFIGVRQVHIDA